MALSAAAALDAAIASLARDNDPVGTLSRLCCDCADVMGAAAAGIMLSGGGGPLELMAAASHRAADIDLYEIQAGQGPCIEAARTRRMIIASSAGEITAHWPVFGPGRRRDSPLPWPARCAGTASSSAP